MCGSPCEQPRDLVQKVSADSPALAGVFHGFLTAAKVEECIDRVLVLPETYGFCRGALQKTESTLL